MSVAAVPREFVDVLETPARATGGYLRARGRPLRLSLSPSISSGALDGAWWPYSHDLRVEALDLANTLPPSLGRILRVIYCPADWTSGTGRVKADNVVVTLASFPDDENTGRVLLRTDWRRGVLQLRVVPPESDDRAARHAMRIAASPSNQKSVPTILALFDDKLRPGLLGHWDDDGGHPASR
jgi:Family of unknown function (DUF5994)